MSKGGEKALRAFGQLLNAYFDAYAEGWSRYGAAFSILLCVMLLIQAPDFLASGWMGQGQYLGIVFLFLFSSLLVTLTGAFDAIAAYSSADQVAYDLGTKKAPPWYRPALPLLVMVWAVSFIGIVQIDTAVTYYRIVNMDLSLPAIAANILLLAQIAAPLLGKRLGLPARPARAS